MERAADMMAIGGRLLVDVEQTADVMVIDVTVMDGDRRREVRAEVVERILAAPAEACGARTEQKAEAIRTALGARAMRVT